MVHVIHSPLSTGKEESGVGSGVRAPGRLVPPPTKLSVLSPPPQKRLPGDCVKLHIWALTPSKTSIAPGTELALHRQR